MNDTQTRCHGVNATLQALLNLACLARLARLARLACLACTCMPPVFGVLSRVTLRVTCIHIIHVCHWDPRPTWAIVDMKKMLCDADSVYPKII